MRELLLHGALAQENLYLFAENFLVEQLVDTWPLVGILVKHFVDETAELVRVVSWQSLVLASNDLHGEHVDVGAVKRRLQCAHFIQQHPKRPQITFKTIWLIVDNFWTEVVWRANDRNRLLNRITQHFCDSKISEFYNTVLRQKYVARFQITVQNLPIMTMFHSKANLGEPV